MGDGIGLLWDAERTTQHCPYSAQFTYGSAPANFEVAFPRSGSPVSFLNSEIEYWVVVGRGQGGPEDYSLKDSKLSSGRPQWLSGMCWGDLKVPERTNPAWVRVDCKTNRPLEMTSRGMARLNLYREKKIVFY